jgi:GNAT superfamily N-acetyltransferase
MQLLPTAWSTFRVAIVEDLFVIDSCRGRGVGHALVEAAIKEASALGCAAMSLDTNERNQASQAVYRRLGFTCERARWAGGRQIQYDLRLGDAAPAAPTRKTEPHSPNRGGPG